MAALAERLGVDKIQDCVFYEFKSGIPQIEKYMLHSMSDIEKLNKLAEDYSVLSAEKRTMFKAVMEKGYVSTLDSAIAAFKCMDNYEFDFESEDSDEFFKKYLIYHAPSNLDSLWLAGINSEYDAERLMQRLGATVTPYGVVSKQYGSLFASVPYDDGEKYDLIEICGQKALYTESTVHDSDIPEGMYHYDIRESEHEYFSTLEPQVVVNRAGTVITKEPIDFGTDGYIELDEDSSPNFLGEEMTVEEFSATDFSEEYDQTGGITL